MHISLFVSAALWALPTLIQAQLSGSVGPTTSTASKAAKKVCNVLSYGAKADKSTDLGPALLAAWNACKTGGIGDRHWLASSRRLLIVSNSLGPGRGLRHGHLADAQWRLRVGFATRWYHLSNWVSAYAPESRIHS